MNLLDVGCGLYTNANIFKGRGEIDVTRLDIDPENKPDVVHDLTKPLPDKLVGAFDIVLASHVLEHVRYREVQSAAKNIISGAKQDGEVWIFVPSMEWAARQVLAGRETFGLMGVIWGGQYDPWDYHYSGFTRNSLATLMTKCGLRNVKVAEQEIAIVLEGRTYPCMQVSAMGYRV